MPTAVRQDDRQPELVLVRDLVLYVCLVQEDVAGRKAVLERVRADDSIVHRRVDLLTGHVKVALSGDHDFPLGP